MCKCFLYEVSNTIYNNKNAVGPPPLFNLGIIIIA